MPEKEELQSASGRERGLKGLWAAGQPGLRPGLGTWREAGDLAQLGQLVPTSQRAGAVVGAPG